MNENAIIQFKKTDNILTDVQTIIEFARQNAYQAVNISMLQRNWLLGYRIAEEELSGKERAEYGLEIIKKLSTELTEIYGKGFTKSTLYNCYSFYKTYPQIFQTLFGKSQRLLSWSHYLVLLQVHDETARAWYEQEALSQTWNVRTLQRNVSSQYYYRLLSSQNQTAVEGEMKKNTSEFQFLMELGKGYAFVARQQHIHTEKEDYYIDLVFYNYILKCFVLIDLKTSKITHQDVGQMDMYIRMYDELKKSSDDNPTIGIVLCSDTDSDIAKYSILHGNEQLFASKYKLYLPSEEELRNEIETQKAIFYLQHGDKNE